MVSLCCPVCHQPLSPGPSDLNCATCGIGYPVLEGIPTFVQEDPFYEGRWAEPDRSLGSLRNWLVKKERFFLTRLAGRRGTLLDLGCGGGWRLFTRVGPVAGIDLSRASLKAAARIYPVVASAHLARLPFADESFDFVVSLDVLGHIPGPEKDAVLQEVYRVLKRGGRTLHYVETEGDDPLTRFGKSYPLLYKRHILEPEGHLGLESPGQALERFRRLGLKKVKEMACYKMLTYIHRFVQCFDNEYRRHSPLLDALVSLCRILVSRKPVELASNLGVALLMEVTDGLLPLGWASGLLVEYEK